MVSNNENVPFYRKIRSENSPTIFTEVRVGPDVRSDIHSPKISDEPDVCLMPTYQCLHYAV